MNLDVQLFLGISTSFIPDQALGIQPARLDDWVLRVECIHPSEGEGGLGGARLT